MAPRRLIFVAALVAAVGVFAGVASAKVPCGVAVFDDWYGSKTGQLSKVYRLHCYRDALQIVASRSDLSIYSDARQDILLALQGAIARGQAKPGAITDPLTADALPSFLGGPDARSGGRSPNSDRPATIRSSSKRSLASVGSRIGSAGASSVPLPAIMLAGTAVLLLVLGVVGFLAKRKQART